MVPEAGLEPARCCHRGILSPLRLPISPLGQSTYSRLVKPLAYHEWFAGLTFNYQLKLGGAGRNRTDDGGVAVHSITTLLPRLKLRLAQTPNLKLKRPLVGGRLLPPKQRLKNGAGNRVRTGDLNLGKVALYQLSYSRNSLSILLLITTPIKTNGFNWLMIRCLKRERHILWFYRLLSRKNSSSNEDKSLTVKDFCYLTRALTNFVQADWYLAAYIEPLKSGHAAFR